MTRPSRRCQPAGTLAALGPRKLELARDRAAGAIPLLVTPAYTSAARRILGDEATLIIDQMIVLDTDVTRAREIARRPLQFLSGISGYRANFARMGFTGADIDGLTDRIVDELVAWGDACRSPRGSASTGKPGPTRSYSTS